MYDIIIVGGGPAGLTAALYARRANKTVLIIEKGTFGGQITYSPKVENIPGFISISGNEFAEKLVEQVLEQGAEVECCEVLSIRDGDIKTVVTDGGEFEAKAVIIATGAKHRMLGLEKEESFVGEGISFCAVCDGAFYEGKTVAVTPHYRKRYFFPTSQKKCMLSRILIFLRAKRSFPHSFLQEKMLR